ncbi:IS1595 family transposase [Hyphomicrobium sp. xq]|uniref:IS1595 family transposase n=1 Tax=Hyphomicrobium album TaxID=2665159 RepID=A0A6I3KK38_9HYPH|nr:IS1595 family transposase [Hyphomicrobium album]MTD94107.1 IS1595 family transposase [Hyphomicrobium album]
MSILTKSHFHDEAAAFVELETILWADGPVCPHCGGMDRVYTLKGVRSKPSKKNPEGVERHGLKKCGHCRKQFTVRVGTIFEDSHAPLHKWFQAIHLLCSSKKGISSHQLHRILEVQYNTAWFMAHRIREAMRVGGLKPPMGGDSGIIEVDETIYGRTSTHPKGRARGRGFYNAIHKNVVLSLVERGGTVRSFHVEGSTISQVIPVVNENIAKEASVMTDSAPIYTNRLGDFASHDRVDHSKEEYVRYEDGRPVVHTNTVEGYFSLFKRGMRGVYQHCSEKHLHRYLAEFDFRYNNRSALGVEDTERALKAVAGAKGKRLTYRQADPIR